jgi:hypothetical protein
VQIEKRVGIPAESSFWVEWSSIGVLLFKKLKDEVRGNTERREVALSKLLQPDESGKISVHERAQALTFCVVLSRAGLLMRTPNSNEEGNLAQE